MLPLTIAISGCASDGTPDETIARPVADSVNEVYITNRDQRDAAIRHNNELLSAEGLEQIGEMNQGLVVVKPGGEKGYWVRDDVTHALYPVKQVDGVWIFTLSGAGQRSLDKDKAKGEKNSQGTRHYEYDGGGGGEGGGGGGGD